VPAVSFLISARVRIMGFMRTAHTANRRDGWLDDGEPAAERQAASKDLLEVSVARIGKWLGWLPERASNLDAKVVKLMRMTLGQ
jgi:hypothetical protein